MIIDELITTRTQRDVFRLNELSAKGWVNLTASEKAEYAELHGEYKADDMNRVSEAQEYIADEMNDYPAELTTTYNAAIADVLAGLIFPISNYTLPSPILPSALGAVDYATPIVLAPTKTDWAESDFPRAVTDVGYYLSNVNLLRGLLPITAPATPSTLNADFTYEKANNIETILFATHTTFENYVVAKNRAVGNAKDALVKQIRAEESQWFISGEIYAGEV